jgi:hypothetical protein
MIQTARVTPPNSLLLTISAADPEIATNIDGVIAATSTCVSIGTLSEMDGPTEVTLTDEDVPTDGLQQLYRGTMDTGLRRVAVQTVEGEQVVELPVPGASATITVYGSDEFEPDRIVIRLS